MTELTADTLAQVDVDQLPPQLRELVRLIGLTEALNLVRARGGLPLTIPTDPTRARVLAEVLHPESVEALCRAWGGQTRDLPKPDKVIQQIRDQAIRQSEATAWELARRHRLTRRQITNIRREGRDEPSPQGDLF